MYIETYEKRFEVFDIQQIEESISLILKKRYTKKEYIQKDIYIKNKYTHLKNIRLRYVNNENYLIYQNNNNDSSIKDSFFIINIKKFYFLKKDILFTVEKKRTEYNSIYFKILIDTNIKIKNKKNVCYNDVIEFEYYKYEHKEKVEEVIKILQKKEIISSQSISSTYQKVLNEKN